MQLQPTITFEQYKVAVGHIAAAKPKVSHNRSWQYYVVLALACLAVGLATQFPPARVSALTLCAALMFLWACSKPFIKRSQEKCLRRFYDEEEAKLNGQILIIDGSGITSNQGDGQVSSHHSWASFIYRVDTPDAFLFLPSPNTFVRVPKTTLTVSEQDSLRGWSSTVPERRSNQ